MKKKKPDQEVSIFSDGALRITQSSARTCQGIFEEIEAELKKASRQVSGKVTVDGGMLVLSHAERMKWPFLQPGIEGLRAELEKSKGTLMLVLQVTTLGYTEALAKVNKPASMTTYEKEQLIRAIEALDKNVHRQKRLRAGSVGPHNSVGPQNTQADVVASKRSKALQNKSSEYGLDTSPQDLEEQVATSDHQLPHGAWSTHRGNQQVHPQKEAKSPDESLHANPTTNFITSSASRTSSQVSSDHTKNKQGVPRAHRSIDYLPPRIDSKTRHTERVHVPLSKQASNQISPGGDKKEPSERRDIGIQTEGAADSITQLRSPPVQNNDHVRDIALEDNTIKKLAESLCDAMIDRFSEGSPTANTGCFTRLLGRWHRRNEGRYTETLVRPQYQGAQSVPQRSGPSLFGNAQLGPQELGLPSPPPISPPAPPLQPYPRPPAPPQLILGSQFPQPQFRRRPSPPAQFPLNHGKRIIDGSDSYWEPLENIDRLRISERQMARRPSTAAKEDESTESTEDTVSNLEAAPSRQTETTSKPRKSQENVVEDLLARYTTLYD
ncbi:MAG: hypothetical protein M1830_005145 [Pleopsidium flavum]|nr:MAG: hypothetical protein M1830_005145 [Pleopsidium flavum]